MLKSEKRCIILIKKYNNYRIYTIFAATFEGFKKFFF